MRKSGAILKKFTQNKYPVCASSAVHRYSSLFYPSCVSPLVKTEMQTFDHKPSAAEQFEVIKRLTAETWAKEDEETIAVVTASLEADKVAKHAVGVCEDSARRAPEDYQRYVSSPLLSQT